MNNRIQIQCQMAQYIRKSKVGHIWLAVCGLLISSKKHNKCVTCVTLGFVLSWECTTTKEIHKDNIFLFSTEEARNVATITAFFLHSSHFMGNFTFALKFLHFSQSNLRPKNLILTDRDPNMRDALAPVIGRAG